MGVGAATILDGLFEAERKGLLRKAGTRPIRLAEDLANMSSHNAVMSRSQ